MDDLEFFERLQHHHTLIHKDKDGCQILEKLNSCICGEKKLQRLAICILNLVLNNCDHEIFEENATTWMRFLLQIISSVPSDNLMNLSFDTLAKLLEFARDSDKVSRDVATKGIDPLLVLLVGQSLMLTSEKINMINCCIRNFPGPCGTHRSSILKVVTTAIESDDHNDFTAAYQLFALLPVCGSAGEKKNRLVENWVNQFYQVMNTIHLYISKLINKESGAIESGVDKLDSSNLIQFSEIKENVGIDFSKIPSKIEKLLLILLHVINTPMPFEIPFPMLKLVNLFCTVSNMIHVEIKEHEIMKVKILDVLLRCLAQSIIQFTTMLIPFAQQIMLILTSAISSSFITQRTSVYQCLLDIFNHWKSLHITSNIVDSIFISISDDIKIDDIISNINGSIIDSHKNENNLQRLTHEVKERNNEMNSNSVLCQNACAALKVLEKIIIINGPIISADSLKSVISNILNIFGKLYTKERFLAPYSCHRNRLLLFNVCRRLLTLHHGSVRIPTCILLSYFNMGMRDIEDKIKCYCCQVLLEFDSVLHPLNHSYYDKLSLQSDVNGVTSMEQLYSEDVKVKEENVNHRPSFDAVVPSSNDTITPVSTIQLPTRLCQSADQVLVKETLPLSLPVRASSEPTIQENNALSSVLLKSKSNTVIMYGQDYQDPKNDHYIESTMDSYNEDITKVEDDDDEGTVIISDSEEEMTTYQPNDCKNGSSKPANIQQNGCSNLEISHNDNLDTMYPPTNKKPKLDNGVDSSYVGDEDEEFVKIIGTFCEIDADD